MPRPVLPCRPTRARPAPWRTRGPRALPVLLPPPTTCSSPFPFSRLLLGLGKPRSSRSRHGRRRAPRRIRPPRSKPSSPLVPPHRAAPPRSRNRPRRAGADAIIPDFPPRRAETRRSPPSQLSTTRALGCEIGPSSAPRGPLCLPVEGCMLGRPRLGVPRRILPRRPPQAEHAVTPSGHHDLTAHVSEPG